jgi:octopine/nopaline transport system permease protein
MDLALIVQTLPQLLNGLVLTVLLTIASVVAGSFIAVPLALAGASGIRIISLPVRAYTFVFRGTPLLVQLFLVYYGLGQLEWVRASVAWPIFRDPSWCALIAFSLNNSAYTTEILRGGLRAVPPGEIEAGKALGMPLLLRIRRITLPIAFRLSLPAYGNEVILMLKASSLASTITIMELTGTSRKIVAQTFAPYEVFVAAALLYLAVAFLFASAFGLIEHRLSKHNRRIDKQRKVADPARLSRELA